MLVIAIDFAESCLAVYMFASSPAYPDWIVVPHSLLFVLAIVVDAVAGIFLLTSLLVSTIRRLPSLENSHQERARRRITAQKPNISE